MSSADTRIRYRRSGGFAGVTLESEATLDELPTELRTLVERGDLQAVAESTAPAGADRFQHELVVERAGHEQRTLIGDHEVTDEVRPLLDFMQARARQSGKS